MTARAIAWLLSSLVAQESSAPPIEGDFARALAEGAVKLAAPVERGLDVRVIRRGGGEPVEGAIVGMVDIEALVARRADLRPDRLALLPPTETTALFARTDREGRARLPDRFHEAWMIAEKESARGFASFEAGSRRPVEIEIAPPTSLRVAVVEADGSPHAGAVVDLEGAGRERTGADGTVEFAGLELMNAAWYRSERGGARVEVVAPLREWLTDRVDLRQPPGEPIRLVLPPTGALVVRVVDSEGRPVAIGGSGELAWSESPRDEKSFGFELESSGATAIPCVELGLRFRLTATLLEHEPATIEAQGPTKPGETIVVDVPITAAHVVLVGRALDAQGRPLATNRVHGRFTRRASDVDPESPGSVTGLVAADGRFRVDWNEAAGDAAKPPAIRWSAWPQSDLQTPEMELPELPASGEADLGDLVFTLAPRIAHGVVVDDRGEPIPHAFVSAGIGSEINAIADGDGRFELRGVPRHEPLKLYAVAFLTQLSKEVALAPGDPELRFVIPRLGIVEGRLAASDDDPGVPISLRLRGDGDLAGDGLDSKEIAGGGSFRFKPVEPGLYDFIVSLGEETGGGEEIARVAGIEVKPGETTRDLRLQAFDAWTKVRTVEVTAMAGKNAPLLMVEATTLIGERRSPSRWILSRLGSTVRLPTTSEKVDVVVRSKAFRPALVPDVADRATVTLVRELPVRFVVAPLPEPLAGMIVCELSLVADDRRFPKKWREIERSFEGALELVVQAPLPGRYVGRIGLLESPDETGLHMYDVKPFVLADEPSGQTIALVIDPEKIEESR